MLTETSAVVFNVVHGSFVDGWGIRTTLFLKGCPLRCLWCCNPESQSAKPELRVIAEHCDGCGACVPRCPVGALALSDGRVHVDRTVCDICGKCVKACWPGALAVWGTIRTAEDLFQECMQDAEFYRRSGGGVTLSGGEPTLQASFCLEMLRLCHKAGISVAIDTCGQVTSPDGVEALRQADLILFDVKGLDPELHRANTGRSNAVIQQNLQQIEAWGKDVIVRYPVIPDHNQAEAEPIAALLSGLSCVKRVDLIPYHSYGIGKYEQLGRVCPLQEKPIPVEGQESLLALFQSYGLAAQLGG